VECLKLRKDPKLTRFQVEVALATLRAPTRTARSRHQMICQSGRWARPLGVVDGVYGISLWFSSPFPG
jgi:hypothetical protein